LKVASPFSVSQEFFQMQPGEKASLQVDFDPSYKVDKISGDQFSRLTIIHQNHPYKDGVDLVGAVCFPNLRLDQTSVNFGSILSDTSKKVLIDICNVSAIALDYSWSFLEDEVSSSLIDEEIDETTVAPERPKIPINEVFDVLPLSGHLAPEEH